MKIMIKFKALLNKHRRSISQLNKVNTRIFNIWQHGGKEKYRFGRKLYKIPKVRKFFSGTLKKSLNP